MFTSRMGGHLAANIKEDQSVPQEYRHLTGRDAFLAALRRLEAIRQKTGTPVIDFDYGRGAVHGREVPASIRYFNAQDAVEACGGEFVLSETDPHPSPKGHRALADSLYSFMVESGIVRRLMEDPK